MTPYYSFASYLRSSFYDALVLQVRTMLRSLQRCNRGSDMYNDLKFTLEVVDELGRLKLANVLAEVADIDTQVPGHSGRSGDESAVEESWLQGDWVFSDNGTRPSYLAGDAAGPSHTMSCGVSQEYEAPRHSPRMSPPVFSGSTHDGGCIFVPTPGMPTPPLVHAEPIIGPSPSTPHKKAIQIEQILGENIQPMEGLWRSRCPPAHAPDCETGDGDWNKHSKCVDGENPGGYVSVAGELADVASLLTMMRQKLDMPLIAPGGSVARGGTRAGLFRTPTFGGVQSATSAHGLPRLALSVRNLMEQGLFVHCFYFEKYAPWLQYASG
nr:hypothetical protein CFP56_13750 [Quercus suber]